MKAGLAFEGANVKGKGESFTCKNKSVQERYSVH